MAPARAFVLLSRGCACVRYIHICCEWNFLHGACVDYKIFDKVDEYSVFKNKWLLDVSYVPDDLVSRIREEEYFAQVLTRGVREGFLPPMVRVFGRPGSGKTVVVCNVLGRFEEYVGGGFRYFYANLKGNRTVFSACNAVLSSISGKRVPSNFGLDRVFSEIWGQISELKGAGVSFFCLVLDEVDSVFLDKHYDPSDFFYRFLRYRLYLDDDIKLCLVVITNNLRVLEENLDARVRSSMGSESIFFPPYSAEALRSILSSRLGDAFKVGMVEDGVVEYCSELVAGSTGDARKAIDLLRVSGEVANELNGLVTLDCVKTAFERVERDWVQEEIRELPLNPAIILGVITALSVHMETVTFSDLYRAYQKGDVIDLTAKSSVRVLSERSVLDLVNELETVGLISTWNVSRGRHGRRKEIKLNRDPESVLIYFEKEGKYNFSVEKLHIK